jgi:hypothetical protein
VEELLRNQYISLHDLQSLVDPLNGVNPIIEASSFVDRIVFEFLELCQLLVLLGVDLCQPFIHFGLPDFAFYRNFRFGFCIVPPGYLGSNV